MIEKNRPYTLLDKNDFDKLEEQARKAAEAAKAPTYSQAQLDQAKQESFEAGRQTGHREALTNQEERIANSLNTLVSKFDDLIARQSAYEIVQQKESVHIAVSIMRKIMPGLLEKYGAQEIERVIERALKNNVTMTELIITLPTGDSEAIKERLMPTIEEYGYAERVDFKTDKTLGLHDVRLEWGAGGVARIVPALWDEIEDKIRLFLDGGDILDYLEQSQKREQEKRAPETTTADKSEEEAQQHTPSQDDINEGENNE